MLSRLRVSRSKTLDQKEGASGLENETFTCLPIIWHQFNSFFSFVSSRHCLSPCQFGVQQSCATWDAGVGSFCHTAAACLPVRSFPQKRLVLLRKRQMPISTESLSMDCSGADAPLPGDAEWPIPQPFPELQAALNPWFTRPHSELALSLLVCRSLPTPCERRPTAPIARIKTNTPLSCGGRVRLIFLVLLAPPA